ncbi:MAG TPA: DUF1579 family protein [Acidimicrobiia bacterium]|nr:DUF1579 family protein [Acidimicrobiia bacterium]
MPDSPCSTPEARQLDFWLGEWDLTWPAEQMGGAQGDLGRGRNSITRLFDDCVIEENFMTDDASYRGHSVSVYDVSAGVWRQTWVDSAGGYLWLTGGEVDGQMILSTEPVEKEAGVAVNRMVFADVETDSLEWVWQRSDDGGSNWTDLWNISYRRF